MSSPPLSPRRSISVDPNDTIYSFQEQELVASIQDLQRKLSAIEVDTEEDPVVSDRLVMVSNRLPVTITHDASTNTYSYTFSSGGLVTALAGLRQNVSFMWVGWLGVEIPKHDQEEVAKTLLKEYNCIPVFLEKKVAYKYYNEFSNNVLWPIFHYVPLPLGKPGSEKKFDIELWKAYESANVSFGKVISSLYRDGDYIWIHDYHLMALPSWLRKRYPSVKMGWFLHTPFPSSEVYRVLPVRKQILEGLLGADLVGFHTYDYARHFLSACTRLIGIQATPTGI